MKERYLLFLLLLMLSCHERKPISASDFEYIKEKMWSYEGGIKIGQGDFVTFPDTGLFQLHGDTIFYKNQPRATVERLNKQKFELTIRAVSDNNRGKYRNIEESFQ